MRSASGLSTHQPVLPPPPASCPTLIPRAGARTFQLTLGLLCPSATAQPSFILVTNGTRELSPTSRAPALHSRPPHPRSAAFSLVLTPFLANSGALLPHCLSRNR